MRKFTFLISICIFQIFLSGCPPQEEVRDKYLNLPQGINFSQTYDKTYDNIENLFQTHTTNKLKKYKIIFVPGFLSDGPIDLRNFYNKNKTLLKEVLKHFSDTKLFEKFVRDIGIVHLGEYFDLQMEWLKTQEIDFTRVNIESEASPEHNADIIKNEILKSKKEVIIIAHSKGGIDTLTAFVKYPELLGKIKGFIPLQSPFWGSPLADAIEDNNHFSEIVENYLKLLGGSRKSLESLTYEKRTSFFKTYAQEVLTVFENIPIITFATWKEKNPKAFDSPMSWGRDYMDKLELKNDGAVPLNSAILPKIPYVELENVDHGQIIKETNIESSAFDRIKHLKTTLYLILNVQSY